MDGNGLLELVHSAAGHGHVAVFQALDGHAAVVAGDDLGDGGVGNGPGHVRRMLVGRGIFDHQLVADVDRIRFAGEADVFLVLIILVEDMNRDGLLELADGGGHDNIAALEALDGHAAVVAGDDLGDLGIGDLPIQERRVILRVGVPDGQLFADINRIRFAGEAHVFFDQRAGNGVGRAVARIVVADNDLGMRALKHHAAVLVDAMDALAVRIGVREVGRGEGRGEDLAGLGIDIDGDGRVVIHPPELIHFRGNRVHRLRAPAEVLGLIAEGRLFAHRAGGIDIERKLDRLGLCGLAFRGDLGLDGNTRVLRQGALGIVNVFLAVLVYSLGIEPVHVKVLLAAGINLAGIALLHELGVLLGEDLAGGQIRNGVVDVIDVAQQADLQAEFIQREVAVRGDTGRLRQEALVRTAHRGEFEFVHREHGVAGSSRAAQPSLFGHPVQHGIIAGGAVAVDAGDDLIGRVIRAVAAHGGRVAAGLGNGSRAEVAVEREERDGQRDGIGARELDEALDVGAVFKALVIIRLLRIGELQGHGDLRRCTGRDGQLVVGQAGGVGRVELLCVVLREVGDLAALDEAALRRLAEALHAERIGLVLVGEVDDAEGHFIRAGLFLVVAQLELGLVGALDGDVRAGLHGVTDVGKARALTADKVIGAVRFIDDRRGRAHEQAVGDRGIVGFRDGGLFQVLPQQRHGRGDRRRGHRGAGCNGKIVAVVSREHVAADAGDLRLQAQALGRAPGGERGHLAREVIAVPVGHHGDGTGVVVVLHPRKLDQVRTGCGDIKAGQLNIHIVPLFLLGGCRVVEHDTGCTGRLRCGDHSVAVSALERDEHDLAFGIVDGFSVSIRAADELLRRAQALIEALALGNAVQLADAHQLLHVHGLVEPAECANIAEPLHAFVFGAGDRQDGIERAGHTERAGGDAGGLDLLVAPEAFDAGEAVVAGGNADTDARCGGGVIDLSHALVVIRAAGDTEGQVRAVHAERDRVLNCGNQVVEVAVALLVENLHDDELCLRRDAEVGHVELLLIRLGQVARDDAGNVRAVAHPGVVVGAEVGHVVAVVEAERDLAAVINGVDGRIFVQLLGVQGLAFEDGGDVGLAVGDGIGVGRLLVEGRVFIAQAGVDDGDAHAGAVKARIPRGVRAHTGSGELHIRGDLGGFRFHGIDLRHGVARGKEYLLNARQAAERFHVAVGNGRGDGVGHERELARDLHAAAELPLGGGDDGGLAVLHLPHGGLFGLTEALAQRNGHAVHFTDRRFVEQDDDLDLIRLFVAVAHDGDLVARVVILAAQDRLYGIGIGGGFRSVIFAADQRLAVVRRDGAFGAIGQGNQRLGFRRAEGAAGNVGILRRLARVGPSIGRLIYVSISRRDVGGLAVCGVNDLVGRLVRLRSALRSTDRGHEQAEHHCQTKGKRHQLFRQRFHFLSSLIFYSPDEVFRV